MGTNKIFFEFFLLMAILWLLWVFGGGPERITEGDQPFLKPPSPLNTGSDFGSSFDLSTTFSVPDMKKSVSLRSGGSGNAGEAVISLVQNKNEDFDYIEIVASVKNKEALNITGWKIKSVTNQEPMVVAGGVEVPVQGKVAEVADILLYPGERAYILPGFSPLGYSFKVNKCSGYFEQFQEFLPHLSQSCPQPALDIAGSLSNDYSCDLFLRSIPRCSAYVTEFPSSVSSVCRNLAGKRINYNSCVSEHRTDGDFEKGEWRVYLGGTDSFGSKNGDLISIFDAEDDLVDTIFYKL